MMSKPCSPPAETPASRPQDVAAAAAASVDAKQATTTINIKKASFHQPNKNNNNRQHQSSSSSLRFVKGSSQHSKFTNSTCLGDSSLWMSQENCPYDDDAYCEPTEEETETDLGDGALQDSFASFAFPVVTASQTPQPQQAETAAATTETTSDRLMNLIELTALLEEVNQPDKYSKRKRTRHHHNKDLLTLEEMGRILQHINASDDAEVSPRWDLIQALMCGPPSFEEEDEELLSDDDNDERDFGEPRRYSSPLLARESTFVISEPQQDDRIIQILDIPKRIPSEDVDHDCDAENNDPEEGEEASLDPLELWDHHSVSTAPPEEIAEPLSHSLTARGGSSNEDKNQLWSSYEENEASKNYEEEEDMLQELGETGHEHGQENYQLHNQKVRLVHKQQHLKSPRLESGSKTESAEESEEEEEISLTLSQLEIRSEDSESSSDTESTFSLECVTESVASSVTWQEDGYTEVPVSQGSNEEEEEDSDESPGSSTEPYQSNSSEPSPRGSRRPGPMNPTISSLLDEYDKEDSVSSSSASPLPDEIKLSEARALILAADVSPYGLGENDSLELHRRNKTKVRNNTRQRRRTHPRASIE